jgi:hypothetical protein
MPVDRAPCSGVSVVHQGVGGDLLSRTRSQQSAGVLAVVLMNAGTPSNLVALNHRDGPPHIGGVFLGVLSAEASVPNMIPIMVTPAIVTLATLLDVTGPRLLELESGSGTPVAGETPSPSPRV